MVDTDDTRRTTPRVWHKLPTGELKIKNRSSFVNKIAARLTLKNKLRSKFLISISIKPKPRFELQFPGYHFNLRYSPNKKRSRSRSRNNKVKIVTSNKIGIKVTEFKLW